MPQHYYNSIKMPFNSLLSAKPHSFLSRATACVFTVICLLLMASCGTGRQSVSRGKKTTTRTVGAIHGTMPQSGKNNGGTKLSGSSQALVNEAYTWLGTRYEYGGHSKSGTDCSGLVMEVFLRVLNLKLPRASYQQQAFCKVIERGQLSPGDLVFFSGQPGGGVSHVGIYVGDNQMIHASASKGVMVSNIFEKYFVNHYHSSGHIEGVDNRAEYASHPVQPSMKSNPEEYRRLQMNSAEVHINDLDRVLSAKTDSILSSFMD